MIPRIGTKTKNAFFLFSSSPSPISPRLFSSSGQKKNNIELEEWLNNPQSHPYPPSLLDTSSLGEGVCPSSLGLSIFPEFVTEEEEKQMAKEILEQVFIFSNERRKKKEERGKKGKKRQRHSP